MASKKKKQPSPQTAKNAGRKGRAVQVKQPKPWGLILTFSGVGVIALGLIVVAAVVVADRSEPPEGVTSFYGPYEGYQEASDAIADGEITPEDLDHPWVMQQVHVDGDEDPNNDVPVYELTPPAGGNHLSEWQTCTGIVYPEPIGDGNAIHSLEHGAVWLTYDPELASETEVAELSDTISGRDYSFMSPYPGQGVKVSLQSWGNQYQTDDVDDSNIDKYLSFYIQNRDYAAEMNATCSGGTSATQAAGAGGDLTDEEYQELLEEMENAAEDEGAAEEEG